MVVVRLGDEAALRHGNAPHVGIVRRDAHHVGARQLLVAASDLHVVVVQGRHGFGGFHVVAQAFVIFHGDQGALLRFYPSIIAGDNSEAVHDEDVCAKVSDFVGDIEIHAGDEAHHDDQNQHREDYAKKSEETTELMGAEGVYRQAKGLEKRDERATQASEPETLGARPARGHSCQTAHGNHTQCRLRTHR